MPDQLKIDEGSKHNPYLERLKKVRPNDAFETDEDIEKGVVSYMDELEGYRNRSEEANLKLIGIMEANPEIVEILRDMAEGATLAEALARHVDPEDLTPIEGDPDYEKWKQNREARAKAAAARKAKEQEFSDNMNLSEEEVKQFAEEQGLSEEEAGTFLGTVESAFQEIATGKISKSFLQSMFKALNYDGHIAAAREKGKIEGKNEKIVVEKASPIPAGDGLPKLGGGGAPPAPVEKKEKPDIFDRVNAKSKKPI